MLDYWTEWSYITIMSDRRTKILEAAATLIAERPRILPHLAQMKANIAAATGLRADCVGIKATTNERMGFAGREEGMCAMAVACIEMPDASA